jgi:CBS domain-containing protein
MRRDREVHAVKRVNIQAAFVGEPSSGAEGLDTADSDEAVLLRVRGGELTIVVPFGTTDERVVGAASCVRGALHLENERVLTFEIRDGAEGAFFEDEPAKFHRQREAAPSSGDMFRATGAPPLLERSTAASTPVRSIMASEVVSIPPTTPVEELAALLAFHHVSGVPVVDAAGRLVGVVTESDVIARGGATVGDMMTRDVLSVTEEETIARAASLIAERRVRRLPVVRDGRVVGLVSQADVVRWLAAQVA